MDRRIFAGFVGLLLASPGGESSFAQTPPATRDPSSQPAVGMGPIRSINDSINDVSVIPGPVPLVSNKVPTSPVGSGPAATIPTAPVLTEPVSMTPLDPLHHSISHGFGSGRIAQLFRKPGARPTTPSSTTPVRYLPSLGASTTPPPTFNRLPALPSPPSDTPAAVPTGRPSPYSGRLPETARPQADPVVVPASSTNVGRPSPYLNRVPQTARAQSPSENSTPAPRPQLEPTTDRPTIPSTTPAPRSAEPTVPIEKPGADPILPVELPLPARLEPIPTTPGPTPAETPSIPPVGAIVPVRSELPALESTETVAAAPAPVVVNVSPPEVLPDLGSVIAEAKPLAQVAQTTPTPAVAPSTEVASTPAKVDGAVKQTSIDEAALQIKQPIVRRRDLTFTAASVGDEIITINELEDAVRLQMAEYPEVQNMTPGSPEFREVMNQVAGMTLNHLIDERLILLDGKAKIHSRGKGKAEESFNEYLENMWKTEELAGLLHEYHVTNIHELKIKMSEKGKNFEKAKAKYLRKLMAQQFLNMELRNRVTHDMIELREYYETHESEFIRPARMTWREIEVNVSRYPDRATARKKADELLARLLHNESFETVARTSSNGPTANQGGIYVDMEPGSYGISSVNDELNRIPIGQISQVIEAPGSFHIIRVDSRRDKGPLRFDEVQDTINEQVIMKNYSKAVTEYLARLRTRTTIRTMFENTERGLVEARSKAPMNQPPVTAKIDPAVQTTAGGK